MRLDDLPGWTLATAGRRQCLANCRTLSTALAAPATPRVVALALALVAAPALAVLLTPWVFTNALWQDLFVPLDAAWRLENGQWPHTDYYTPVGSLYAVLEWAGWRLAGGTVRALPFADLLVWAALAPAATLIALRRLPPVLALPAAVFIATLVIDPHDVDLGPQAITNLAGYNRWSQAALCIVALWALLPPRALHRRWGGVEALVIAGVWAAQFYLKAPILAAMAVVLGGGVAAGVHRRSAALLPLAALAAAVCLAPPPARAAYLADLAHAAHAASGLAAVVKVASDLAAGAVGLGASGLLVGVAHAMRRRLDPTAPSPLVLAGAMVAAGLVAGNQSHPLAAPLFVLLPLVPFRGLCDLDARDTPHPPWGRAAAGIVVGVALAVPIAGQALGIAVQAANGLVGATTPEIALLATLRLGRAPTPQDAFGARVPGEAVTRLLGTIEPNPLSFVQEIEDGSRLLRSIAPGGAPVASLTFSNPFPAVLGWPPPRHWASWWKLDHTYGPGAPFDPSAALADTALLMVPRFAAGQYETPDLLAAADGWIATHCARAGQSTFWTAYACTPSSPER